MFAVEHTQASRPSDNAPPLVRPTSRVGAVHGTAEHEADRVAQGARASSAHTGLLQRSCTCGGNPGADGECAACREKRLRRHGSAAGPAVAPPIVHEALDAPGGTLDVTTRSFFEQRLGLDLDSVRIHTDTRAAESAEAVGALAYTVGNDVVFGAGRWAPQTTAGHQLLAHELTHVAQQRSLSTAAAGALEIGDPHDPAEREAGESAIGLGQGRPGRSERLPSARLARQRIGDEPAPLTPVLHPADPGVAKILETLTLTAAADEHSVDPACQSAVASSPPWMPNLRQRSPIDLGEGTRRHPKLKEPDGPSGAKCRGACGPDCPDTCKTVGAYTEQYEIGSCGYVIEFPNALLCGTHAGCRSHDGCFDAAVANGETNLFGPRHNECNQDALFRWGPANTKSWVRGGGPYDEWWYFVDNPVIRRSWRVGKPGSPPASSPSP